MKKLLYANYAVLTFLLLIIALGGVAVTTKYLKYGVSYTETVIIGEEIVTREVSIYEGFFSVIVFMLIFAVVLGDTIMLRDQDSLLTQP